MNIEIMNSTELRLHRSLGEPAHELQISHGAVLHRIRERMQDFIENLVEIICAAGKFARASGEGCVITLLLQSCRQIHLRNWKRLPFPADAVLVRMQTRQY